MACSSGTRNVVKLLVGWCASAGVAAVLLTHFEEVRTALGLRIEAADIKDDAAPHEAAPSPREEPVQASALARTVELRAAQNGHFHARAYVNGRPVDVLVDTGATIVALTAEDARAAGVHVSNADFTHRVSTANGTARVAMVTLHHVAIDEIVVYNVRAAVAEPGRLATTLLGMSFLGQLRRAEMRRGVLVLEQ
jgi:aspartyl protease family protein